MEPDWKALGAALRHARVGADLTQLQVASEIGVSRSTVQSIERGTHSKKVSPTLRAYATIFGNTDDDLYAVLLNRCKVLPRRGTSAPSDPFAQPVEQAAGSFTLPLRISDEIERGHLVDTDVIPIGPPDADARVIIIVKAGVQLAPESREKVVSAWRALQETLRDELSSASPGS